MFTLGLPQHPSQQIIVPFSLPYRPLKAAVKPERRDRGFRLGPLDLSEINPRTVDQCNTFATQNISHQTSLSAEVKLSQLVSISRFGSFLVQSGIKVKKKDFVKEYLKSNWLEDWILFS